MDYLTKMGKTRNKNKSRVGTTRKRLGGKLRAATWNYLWKVDGYEDPDSPWKSGKPKRDQQSDRNKRYRRAQNKRLRRYIERNENLDDILL